MAADRTTALAVWRELLQFHRRAVSGLDAELRTERELSLDEYDILLQLAEGPADGLRMGELAEGAVIAPSSCTRVVDHLVRSGLVERLATAADRRTVLVAITREGRRQQRRCAVTHVDGIERRFSSRLTATDLADLARIMRKLADG